MKIGLYRNEYGVSEYYKEYPLCEINMDYMTLTTDYTVERTGTEQRIQDIDTQMYWFHYTATGAEKIVGKSKSNADAILPSPFWTTDDDNHLLNIMNSHGNYTNIQHGGLQPDDWDTAKYWKYFTYDHSATWEQYRTVLPVFDSSETYYTCDNFNNAVQAVYYAKNNLATSFIVSQFIGSPPNSVGWWGYSSGGCVAGWGQGVNLVNENFPVSRTRVLSMKDPQDTYEGWDTQSYTDYSFDPVRLQSWQPWNNTLPTPYVAKDLPCYWNMAKITYHEKEYIGWGVVVYDKDDPDEVIHADFICANIECFADAIIPDPTPYGQGTKPGGDGTGGMGTGLPDGDPMVPTCLEGGLGAISDPSKSGFHAYIIDQTNFDRLNDFLWGSTDSPIWAKYSNFKLTPMSSILGLFRLPGIFMPNTLNMTYTKVHMAGVLCNGTGTGTDAIPDIEGYAITNEYHVTKPIANLSKPDYVFTLTDDAPRSGRRPYHSFADYSRTHITLHIPFCGDIDIDADKCIGGRIEVFYQCDLLTGNCGAQVSCYDINGNNHIVATATGNCAYQIPISGADNSNVGSVMSSLSGSLGTIGTSALTSVMTGNPMPLIGGVANSAINVATGIATNKQVTNTIGTVGSNPGWLVFRSMKLDITWGDYLAEDGSYANVNGRPSCDDSRTVLDFEGYAELKANTSGISYANDTEKEKIRVALNNGIFINVPSS